MTGNFQSASRTGLKLALSSLGGIVLTAYLLFLGWLGICQWMAHRAFHAAQNNQHNSHIFRLYRRAAFWRPDLSWPWRFQALALMFSHPRQGLGLAKHACRLNPDNWRNWHVRGMLEYELNDMPAARRDLLQSARLNSGFAAHFELANFAFILHARNLYKAQMRQALLMVPANVILPTLTDFLRLENGHVRTLELILPRRRTRVQAMAIDMLSGQGHLPTAMRVWRHLFCPRYRRAICKAVSVNLSKAWLLQAQKASLALEAASSGSSGSSLGPAPQPLLAEASMAVQNARDVWNQAVREKILNDGMALSGHITDAAFHYPWMGGFSWQYGQIHPLLISRPGANAVNTAEFSFSGVQPSHILLLSQWLCVRPGRKYDVQYSMRGDNVHHPYGITLQVGLPSGMPVASLSARIHNSWHSFRASFYAPKYAALLKFSLIYSRPLGHSLLRGNVWFRSLNLKPSL